MSTNLTPAFSGPSAALAPTGAPPLPAEYRGGGAVAEAPPVSTEAQIGRIVAALGRHKWLIGVLSVLGAAGGFAAAQFVEPKYVVQSAILITGGLRGQNSDDRGPLRDDQAVDPQGWMDLIKTNAIADSVVMQLALYVEPDRARDSVAFRNFQINQKTLRFIPGNYTLSAQGARYSLRDDIGVINEQGVLGDSVGRTAGFAWQPSRGAISGRTIKFRVQQPREASVAILKRLQVGLARGSNLMFIQLSGTAQQKPAATLNAWNAQFIRIATGIKTARIAQSSQALAEQRATAAQRLTETARAFEQFRVATIDQPSEALAIQNGPGGVPTVHNDPAMDNYTASKYQLEALRRDRRNLERVAATVTPARVPVEALLNVGLVNNDPAAVTLRTSLGELLKLENDIRQLRRTQQDANPVLKSVVGQRDAVAQTIPQELTTYLTLLQQRDAQIAGVLSEGSQELRAIPQRTTQLEALKRDHDAAAVLFTNLNARYEEARLAERSMAPDVRVLDAAVLPSQPSETTPARLIAFGLVVGLGAGLGIAVLRDRLDGRFRYPSQATHDLGLQILGVVPKIDQSRPQSPERVAQIVEAFRSVRMNVRYANAPNPRVTLTVTSPGAGDGKSLVASNLALSFAEGGWRTVLIDGDLRRGQLNATFDLPDSPGLVEYLEGTTLLSEVLQETAHDNLSLIACGTKHRRGPELLGTPQMSRLIATLAAEYDAVIVDSPPLGAGTDAYALGAATANVALVLRRASTDLKLAQAKLQALDTLPVQVIGAVLNEVQVEARMYQHFAYDPDYVLVEGEGDSAAADESKRLAAR